MQLNLDDIGGAKELAQNTAREDLEAAQLNFENRQYRASNNRAYYAVFRTRKNKIVQVRLHNFRRLNHVTKQ